MIWRLSSRCKNIFINEAPDVHHCSVFSQLLRYIITMLMISLWCNVNPRFMKSLFKDPFEKHCVWWSIMHSVLKGIAMLSDIRCQLTGDALDSSSFDSLNGTAHPDAGSCHGQENSTDALKDDTLSFDRSLEWFTQGKKAISSISTANKCVTDRQIFAAVINVYLLQWQMRAVFCA